MRTHPIVEYYQALRDSAPCLSRAATLPKGTKLGLGKRRAPGNTIILSQPYRRRVSTDRLNREGSQLAASLEGKPGPTPAGKTLPHSFPETSRFRRERARDYSVLCVFSSHSFWTSSLLDVPAGVTQEEGHTGFLIHLLSAVHALIFLARRIQPFLSLVDREVEFCVLTI